MNNLEDIIKMAGEAGFTHAAYLDCDTIEVNSEVRDMCATNTCHRYDKCWSCPPGCGDLKSCEEKIRKYHHGILVQTVGDLEDSMDVETMMDTEKKQKDTFLALYEKLRELYPDMMALGSGSCTICKECSYPDKPCRFPKKAVSSMEAYGILVTDACKANNMEYYYGPNTIAYTSCYLLE